MSSIHSRGNRATELALLRAFRRHGLTGWRRGVVIGDQRSEVGDQKSEVGGRKSEGRKPKPKTGRSKAGGRRPARFAVRPDFVFLRRKLAVFVDGCFWHGCPQHATRPKHNAAFWRKKLAANRARDRFVNRTLRARGWKVLRIWEHELARKHESKLLRRLNRFLGDR